MNLADLKLNVCQANHFTSLPEWRFEVRCTIEVEAQLKWRHTFYYQLATKAYLAG